MLGTPLNIRVRRTLGVTRGVDMSLSFIDTPTIYFPAHLTPPTSDNSTFEGSPRSGLSPWKLTWDLGPRVPILACDRIETLDERVFELLADERPISQGRRIAGYSAPLLPVAALYPRTAEVRLLGADDALATVECAVFQSRESHGQRTTYEESFCEMPPSAWEYLNRKESQRLVFADGIEVKIGEASLGTEVPFVTATLKGGV